MTRNKIDVGSNPFVICYYSFKIFSMALIPSHIGLSLLKLSSGHFWSLSGFISVKS
jgi:hypothetical protein